MVSTLSWDMCTETAPAEPMGKGSTLLCCTVQIRQGLETRANARQPMPQTPTLRSGALLKIWGAQPEPGILAWLKRYVHSHHIHPSPESSRHGQCNTAPRSSRSAFSPNTPGGGHYQVTPCAARGAILNTFIQSQACKSS